MASPRRRAPADSEMRTKLIAAAEEIIRDQGHGALTSRTLADKLSLKRQIVHYYFESIDDLLVQVVRSCHERATEALLSSAQSANPLQAMWQMSTAPGFAMLALELAALAARRPAVREEVRASAEAQRVLQTQILTDHLNARGIKPAIDPEIAVFVILSMSQTMVQEDAIGITGGHDKIIATVEQALQEFDRTGGSSTIRHG